MRVAVDARIKSEHDIFGIYRPFFLQISSLPGLTRQSILTPSSG
jgi:hypothetical protein